MKAALKRYAIRVFMTILIIASVVAIVKTSWMHQVFQDIAAGMCLLGSWLCARALWPRKHDEPVTQPMSMPSVPEPVTEAVPTIDIEAIYREALEAAFEDDDGYWSDGVQREEKR